MFLHIVGVAASLSWDLLHLNIIHVYGHGYTVQKIIVTPRVEQ